jgi:hypothetical protein
MGLVPAAGAPDLATGVSQPVVYHGGPVMRPPVTVHTVFWAPPGFAFSGSPGPGVLGYEPLVKQFFADAARASGSASNVFSVLGQYPDLAGAGGYAIDYAAAADSIDDADPYPPKSKQCASPYGTAVCITDVEVGRELDRVISAHDPSGRGLHDLSGCCCCRRASTSALLAGSAARTTSAAITRCRTSGAARRSTPW